MNTPTLTSLNKKQIVAITGLLLILFVTGHLIGNLLFYLGPEVYNAYADKLKHLRPGLYVVEIALAWIFLVHIYFTAMVVHENIKARPIKYEIYKASPQRSFATRIMPFTGFYLFTFLIKHLLDFTFTNHEGMRSVLADGNNYGIYGLVYNTFSDPIYSLFYIGAMFCLGFHLSHGVDSVIQTFGLKDNKCATMIQKFSNAFGLFIALAYSSIPVYVLLNLKNF